jgi:Icc-related predicted phosphoesterase
VIRLAAVGDLHVGRDSYVAVRESLAPVARDADVLLLAGDLTRHGSVEEGECLAAVLRGLEVPMVAVLGNHDLHQDAADAIVGMLEQVGVNVLEGTTTVVPIGDKTVGIAGVKGFGGGFFGACGSEFGEPEMKAFIRHTRERSAALREGLAGLDTDYRVALLHYAPVKDTLMGEKLEIYPFLGSYLLGEAIDEGKCDIAIHGHAHLGSERGITRGGIPVRNVARPVIRTAYRVYCINGHARRERVDELGSVPT